MENIFNPIMSKVYEGTNPSQGQGCGQQQSQNTNSNAGGAHPSADEVDWLIKNFTFLIIP